MSEFLAPDEHIIVMDMPNYGEIASAGSATGRLVSKSLPVDDLKRLRDVGVQTAFEFVSWDRIEAKRGSYDWSIADEMVNRCRAAGLKALLMTPNGVPQWMPDDWYPWTWAGEALRVCLSPWNEDAQAYQNLFIQMVCERYNADDVLCMQSQMQDGEFVMPPGLAGLWDPAARLSFQKFNMDAGDKGDRNKVADVRNDETQAWMRESLMQMVVDQQSIFCEAHPSRTVFMQLHPEYASKRWPATGNFDITEYWEEIQREIKPDHCMHIFFTCFPRGMVANVLPYARKLQMMGVDVITGSEWPEGLRTNTQAAIDYKLRGFLCAPIHPFCARWELEPWMVQAFGESNKKFLTAENAEGAEKKRVGERVRA